jgi:hypothetical protein
MLLTRFDVIDEPRMESRVKDCLAATRGSADGIDPFWWTPSSG